MCVQHGYYAILFDKHGCWRCAFQLLRDNNDDETSSSELSVDEVHEHGSETKGVAREYDDYAEYNEPVGGSMESRSSSREYSEANPKDEPQSPSSENGWFAARFRRDPSPSTDTTDSRRTSTTIFIIRGGTRRM
ncbi:hypothetical protein F5X99DRAFT_171845 [Biscogniauxia marginata]|nr:hypothetical protein F5X99DRAFT_171845 [Biscogniauxia marginata]